MAERFTMSCTLSMNRLEDEKKVTSIVKGVLRALFTIIVSEPGLETLWSRVSWRATAVYRRQLRNSETRVTSSRFNGDQ